MTWKLHVFFFIDVYHTKQWSTNEKFIKQNKEISHTAGEQQQKIAIPRNTKALSTERQNGKK